MQNQLEEPPAVGPVPQYPIDSVDNALKLLLLLGERSELRPGEAAEYLGVATSTAHRLLAMLRYRGFIRQDERSRAYLPGTALTGVAAAILRRFDARQAVRPLLERLNEELAETVHLAALDGATVRFIDAVESPRAVRVGSRLGRSMPANCTSSGKAMLAGLADADIVRRFPAERLTALTPRSLATRAALLADVADVRRRGHATSTEESEEGVCSVAVALGIAAAPMPLAFNVAVPRSRMARGDSGRLAEALRTAVAEAADLLHP
jgi:DNA-binding IclR family transcriptional regulator